MCKSHNNFLKETLLAVQDYFDKYCIISRVTEKLHIPPVQVQINLRASKRKRDNFPEELLQGQIGGDGIREGQIGRGDGIWIIAREILIALPTLSSVQCHFSTR